MAYDGHIEFHSIDQVRRRRWKRAWFLGLFLGCSLLFAWVGMTQFPWALDVRYEPGALLKPELVDSEYFQIFPMSDSENEAYPIQVGADGFRARDAIMSFEDLDADETYVYQRSDGLYSIMIIIRENRRNEINAWFKRNLGQKIGVFLEGRLVGSLLVFDGMREMFGFGDYADRTSAFDVRDKLVEH